MGHATSARLTFVLIARVPSDGVASFQAYEEAVLPLLSEFGGLLERRLRNSDSTIEFISSASIRIRISKSSEATQDVPLLRI